MKLTNPSGDVVRLRVNSLAAGQFIDLVASTTATSGTLLGRFLIETWVAGAFTFPVQALDRNGNASNTLTGVLTVF